jgi:HK97 family phage prohead protease
MVHLEERRFLERPAAPFLAATTAATMFSTPDLRVTRAAGGRVLTGYAAVFHYPGDPTTESQLYPGLRERVIRGAFDRCLRSGADIRCLFNHDANQPPLGRRSAGTLRLTSDRRGLRYECDVPDTQLGHDLCYSIERKDITGSSFTFGVVKQSLISANGDQDDIRELQDLDVYDVGPACFPAYGGTTADMRSSDKLRTWWRTERAAAGWNMLHDKSSDRSEARIHRIRELRTALIDEMKAAGTWAAVRDIAEKLDRLGFALALGVGRITVRGRKMPRPPCQPPAQPTEMERMRLQLAERERQAREEQIDALEEDLRQPVPTFGFACPPELVEMARRSLAQQYHD